MLQDCEDRIDEASFFHIIHCQVLGFFIFPVFLFERGKITRAGTFYAENLPA